MFERLIGRIRCLFGKHHRSKGRARIDGGTYVTVCTYCGVRMRRRGNKDWVVESPPE